MLKKAGEFAGVRNDFECIVRIALRMGYDVRKLVPFGGGGTRADMGQTRGAQSGEADRHAVWLTDRGLEPKMSPYDPTAMLDEIQRLVPAYDISRLELLAGQDVHSQLVQIAGATGTGDPALVMPANDSLFTSGTLGRYSATLATVMSATTRPRARGDRGRLRPDGARRRVRQFRVSVFVLDAAVKRDSDSYQGTSLDVPQESASGGLQPLCRG